MYETQLLKIKIRPGKTAAVVDFMRSLKDREDLSLQALRREGMVVESMFLERRDDGDYLYYYVKARDLAQANQVNMEADDELSREIRNFVSETWDHIVSPEPLLDLDLIQEEGADRTASVGKSKAKSKSKSSPPANSPHVLAG